jgi:hypothetical protein
MLPVFRHRPSQARARIVSLMHHPRQVSTNSGS